MEGYAKTQFVNQRKDSSGVVSIVRSWQIPYVGWTELGPIQAQYNSNLGGLSMAIVGAKGEEITDADWVAVKGERVHEGVKENGFSYKNWEKPPTTVAAKVGREGPTLEVMGDTETLGDTKDCEVREKGEKVTC